MGRGRCILPTIIHVIYWKRMAGGSTECTVATAKYKHPTNPNVVTVPGKESDDIPSGTLHNILRKSGRKEVR